MALLNFQRQFEIPFLRYKTLPVIFLLGIFFFTLFGGWKWGVNLGIDFKGGVAVELALPKEPLLDELRKTMKTAFPDREITLQAAGAPGQNCILLRTEQKGETTQFLKKLEQVFQNQMTIRKVDDVGPKLGNDLMKRSAWAVLWTLLGIIVYVWVRFEWIFGLSALVTLLSDCAAVILFFILSRHEFNEGAIVALLITASYSVNDTVVIFDRIRENRGYRKTLAWDELINLSINETLSRTILTSFTTLLALSVLYFFGGDVISAYSLPLLVGIGFGTSSSILISAPLLAWFPSLKEGKKVAITP